MVGAWSVGDILETGYDDGKLECSEWMLIALFILLVRGVGEVENLEYT